MLTLYTDGGVIRRNPSIFGGTWAWVLVDGEDSVDSGAGVITPQEMGTLSVTNNQTELLAVVKGLGAIYDDEIVQICSDSDVTLGRLFRNSPFVNIPKWMVKKLEQEKRRLQNFSKFTYTLMDGHPTQEQLRTGKGKNGNVTSEWNVRCDQKCQLAAKTFLESLNEVE